MNVVRGRMAWGGFLCLFLASTGIIQAAPSAPQEDVVTLRIKGMGPDHDAALKDALRRAVEQGGRLEIYSQSETQNYQLVRDTILAQSSGLIREYRILGEGEDPVGGYYVEILAKVDRRIIDATWGQVKILLQQMGKPKILVNFVEKINDIALANRGEQIEVTSLLENKIEQLLVEKGFELVDKNQIERLKRDKLEEATIAQDTATVKQLATELGAEMFIVGFARASGPQISDAYGVRLFMWETDVTLKAFWSETGQILFNRSEVGTRGGSRAPGPPGAKDAIAKAGDKLAVECLQAILEKWSRTAVGGGKVVLEISGLDFKKMMIIQSGLQQIQGVQEVNRQWHKPVAKFEIGTVIPAEKFAEILSQMQFPNFALEIEDQKFNTIRASVTAAAAAPETPEQSAPTEVEPPAEEQPPTVAGPRPSRPEEPAVSKPATTRPGPSRPMTTTAPATTQPVTTAPAARPATTQPVTTAPAARPATPQPVVPASKARVITPQPAATAPATRPATTQPVTSAPASRPTTTRSSEEM